MTVVGPHFAFPGLCDLGNGELLMAARDAPGHGGFAVGIRSWRTLNGDDATPTWSQDADVVLHSRPIGVDWRDPCLMVAASGTIIATLFSGAEAYCCRSTDRGRTWSPPVPLGSGPNLNAFGPTGRSACSGPAVEPVPGTLLAAVYGADVPKPKRLAGTTTSSTEVDDEVDPALLTSVRVVTSLDDGQTWASSTLVANGTGDGRAYQEPNLCLLDDGSLYCMMRTGDDQRFFSVSSDAGATWSAPSALAITKASGRPTTIQCRDPQRTMLHIYRPLRLPGSAMYLASTDRGRTWSEPGVLTPGAGTVTPGPGGWFTYAQMVETAPGNVAVAFSVESNPRGRFSIGGASYLFFDRIRSSG